MISKKTIRKALTIIIPLGIGVWIIIWSMSGLTDTDRTEIKNAFVHANYLWISLAVILGLLSHFSRAYRWKFLLQPLGFEPKFVNSVFAIFIGYLVNLLIPRGGEVVRATTLGKYENIPFDKTFGTVIAERIIDLIMLGFIVLWALFYQFHYFSNILLSKIPKNPFLLIGILMVLLVIGLFIYRVLKYSKHTLFIKIRKFIEGFTEGLISIWTMEKRWAFIFHSVFIWFLYVLMFWVVAQSFSGTSHLEFGAIISGFVAGAFGTTANGGLGTFPLAVKEIFVLYQVPANEAWAFGWLMWTAQTLMILVFGLLSVILLPIYNRKFLKD